MGMDRASGWPDSTRTGTGYISEKYSAALQINLFNSLFLSQITNTKYEGDIKKGGDTVIIRTVPKMVVGRVAIGGTINYDTPHSPPVIMNIDKSLYWGFLRDKIEEVQSDIDAAPAWIEQARIDLKTKLETDFLADVITGVSANNAGLTAGVLTASVDLGVTGTPRSVTKDTIIAKIIDINRVLDEQNAPPKGRWLMLPPEIVALVKQSPLAFANQAGDAKSIMHTGLYGQVDGLDIYDSNLLLRASDGGHSAVNCLFGHNMGISFAGQLDGSPEMIKDKDNFGTYYRGLYIYGYKVVKKETVGNAYLYAA